MMTKHVFSHPLFLYVSALSSWTTLVTCHPVDEYISGPRARGFARYVIFGPYTLCYCVLCNFRDNQRIIIIHLQVCKKMASWAVIYLACQAVIDVMLCKRQY